jgi:NADPH-dependent 2,4-dienoyl-CoA reductase/sulfur reductase-like enzyme
MGDRLLVIGGDAAGMSAAAQVRRRAPDMEIVVIEAGDWTSYSACGIPYVVGGSVTGVDDLVARTPEEFRAMRIDVRIGHEVVALDLASRKAEVHSRAHGRTFQLGFDLLHVATGATPRRPDIPGLDLPHVHGVQTLGDADALLASANKGGSRARRVVVVGSGYIGLEMAEAFVERGAAVTVIEAEDEVMGTLDPEMGALVARAMRDTGITVRTGERVTAISDQAVHTPEGEVPADLVILGLGVDPNSDLAAGAGVATGVHHAVVVDRRQRTSVDGVWAAGDCCQSTHLVSGQPVHQALGTVANKQGRVAGINIAGGYATFPGVMGTAVTRICNLEIGRTGLSEREAAEAGFGFVTATITSTNIAGYMRDTAVVTVRLIAERGVGTVLGAQILGGPGSAKRVDVAAALMAAKGTVEELLGLDLGYAPPFSSVWDPLQVAARQTLTLLA